MSAELEFSADAKEQAPVSREAVATQPAPEPDASVSDPVVAPTLEAPVPVAPAAEPHPLDPGGVRFKQVVARSHKERERADALEQELATLRAEVEAIKQPQALDKTPSWIELEAAIAEGRITRAQASEFREQALLKKAEQAVQTRIAEANRDSAVSFDLNRYTQAAPDLTNRESELRQRVDGEFDYILQLNGRSSQGLQPRERRTFELQAVRAVLGPVESIRQVARPKAEPTMEVHSSQQKPTPKPNPDQKLLDGLTPEQVTHYRKMIAAGQYTGWTDVVAELKWTPPVR